IIALHIWAFCIAKDRRKYRNLLHFLLDDGLDPGILAVNVSARQLQQENFADSVKAFLERYGVAPERLELELTETAFFGTHAVAVRSNVTALRDLGVSLALDDFGTGFSSLMLLKQLRVDAIKIDRSFVKELGKSSDDEEIVRAIIALGRNLRLRLVGEGIEDSALADYLHEAGCHYGQGFHYAKPMFENDLRTYLGRAELPDPCSASA
ncbi:MAG: EAL domain-containing protein, partial [Pseudomonadota bacterium]